MPPPLLPVKNDEFSVERRNTSPGNLMMKIESFSLLSKYEISEYESREFEAGGHKWKMIIYLDEKEEEEDDGEEEEEEDDDDDDDDEEEDEEVEEHVSVCLSVCGTESLPMDWEINVLFTFLVYNHSWNDYLCFRGKSWRFNALNLKWRFSKLISKKELTDLSNGYLVDDNCVFGAEVSVIKADHRLNECLRLLKVKAPVKRNWKLADFSKMENVWNSEEFVAGGYKWKVFLHPKGNGSAQGRYISIYLKCVDATNFAPHKKVKVRSSLRIKNKLNDANHSEKFLNHWFRSTNSPGWGYSEFIAIGDVMSSKGFLVDDCCFLEIEGTFGSHYGMGMQWELLMSH